MGSGGAGSGSTPEARVVSSLVPAFTTGHITVYQGDVLAVLRELPAESVDCCVTSPPYWGLRDYGTAGQIGLEPTPDAYVAVMVEVFREVRRVLRPHGTLWLNLGDSYATQGAARGMESETSGLAKWKNGGRRAPTDVRLPGKSITAGLKPKDMVGIPWRVAFALQADGWYLRSDIIWSKPNPMPESVTDRPTKAHEYVFLLAKSERYFYDAAAINEPLTSSPSDLRKMAEGRDRIGGKTLVAMDPLYAANAETHIGQKRGVGNAAAAVVALKRSGNKDRKLDVPTRPNDHMGTSVPWIETPGMGRNARTVWTIATAPYPDAHFATFPRELPERCIKAGCPADGTVLDPFAGSGTTLAVARDLGRKSIGIELSPEYVKLIERRCAQTALDFGMAAD